MIIVTFSNRDPILELVDRINGHSGLILFAIEHLMIGQVFTNFRTNVEILAQAAVREWNDLHAKGQIAKIGVVVDAIGVDRGTSALS